MPDTWDHPRSRGEHVHSRRENALLSGSSPLTRGARPIEPECVNRPGIIPAHAGSTNDDSLEVERNPDHPRSRGEHPCPTVNVPAPPGSSPLTRGAPSRAADHRVFPGIIPAHAGSTCWRSPVRWSSADHPRSRGEHLAQGVSQKANLGSSPLTRGAPWLRGCLTPGRGIIPAHAGSTWIVPGTPVLTEDHPRSRGEHLGWWSSSGSGLGSSPLTRGARPRRRPRSGC